MSTSTTPRRPARRASARLRALSTVLILSGTLLIADAVLTVTWQEPLSALYSRLSQGALEDELAARARLSAAQRRALSTLRERRRRIAFLARALRSGSRPGGPVARLRAPRMNADFVVVEGTDAPALRRAPGHYPDTPLPGLTGTTAIAGHRTTYGAPFRHLDRMRRGDPITVETPYARFVYRTEASRIVAPSAYEYVTRSVGHDRLALTACHPLYSAARRLVVFARLVSVTPRGAAVRS
jgi:sortase A